MSSDGMPIRRPAAVAHERQAGVDRRTAARHLEQHVDALAARAPQDLVDEIRVAREEGRVGADALRQFVELRRVDVDREHRRGARGPGDRDRHQPDRPHPGDRDALGADAGRHHGVHGVPERIEHRRDLVGDRRIERPHVAFGHRDVVGERPVAVDPDDLDLVADMRVARPAQEAGAARDVALGRDALTGLEPAHRGPDRRHGAHELVSDDQRRPHPALRPGVPAVDVLIGAADARFAHPYQHVEGPDVRNGNVVE